MINSENKVSIEQLFTQVHLKQKQMSMSLFSMILLYTITLDTTKETASYLNAMMHLKALDSLRLNLTECHGGLTIQLNKVSTRP